MYRDVRLGPTASVAIARVNVPITIISDKMALAHYRRLASSIVYVLKLFNLNSNSCLCMCSVIDG